MLQIDDLWAEVEGDEGPREILRGLSLTVKAGEVHAIMGPNGSGKSTLANVISGRDGYRVTKGRVLYKGQDLLAQEADERARNGIFLAFQYPVALPGVNNMYFLRTALNAKRRHNGLPDLDAGAFLKLVRAQLKKLSLKDDLLQRPVNVGFSGGEKKRNEIFHMSILEPDLCLLDETDSGLDIDALKAVSDGVNALRSPDRAFVLITHYQRLLSHIQPDVVHVLSGGKIVRTGDASLAAELERDGYAFLNQDAA